MEFRKMVTITLNARQKKRHRRIETSLLISFVLPFLMYFEGAQYMFDKLEKECLECCFRYILKEMCGLDGEEVNEGWVEDACWAEMLSKKTQLPEMKDFVAKWWRIDLLSQRKLQVSMLHSFKFQWHEWKWLRGVEFNPGWCKCC